MYFREIYTILLKQFFVVLLDTKYDEKKFHGAYNFK